MSYRNRALRVVCLGAGLVAPVTLWAGVDFVTDPALCGLSLLERQERGMSFDGRSFREIEYHCELAAPLPEALAGRDITHVTAGYCEEPGALFPGVFVLRLFASEPGVLYLYQGESGEPVTFYQCGP